MGNKTNKNHENPTTTKRKKTTKTMVTKIIFPDSLSPDEHVYAFGSSLEGKLGQLRLP